MNNRRNNKKSGSNSRNNNNPRRNRRRNKINQEGNLVVRVNPRFPNDVKQLPIHNRVFRFTSTNTQTDFQVTPTILLKLLVATTSGSTSAIPIIGSVRLRRVSLYSVPSSNDFGSTSSELVFQWLGNLNTPSNLIVDRGTATSPACIKVVPPLQSRAGMWFSSTTTDVTSPYFQFTCIATTVIDIDIDYILLNGSVTTITLNTAASSTGVAFLQMSSSLIPDGEVYIVRE